MLLGRGRITRQLLCHHNVLTRPLVLRVIVSLTTHRTHVELASAREVKRALSSVAATCTGRIHHDLLLKQSGLLRDHRAGARCRVRVSVMRLLQICRLVLRLRRRYRLRDVHGRARRSLTVLDVLLLRMRSSVGLHLAAELTRHGASTARRGSTRRHMC